MIRVSICSYSVRYATVYYFTVIKEQDRLLLHVIFCYESFCSLQVWNSLLYSVVHALISSEFLCINQFFSLPVVHIVVFVFVLFCFVSQVFFNTSLSAVGTVFCCAAGLINTKRSTICLLAVLLIALYGVA